MTWTIDLEISTQPEKHQSDDPKESLSFLTETLETLQNFFLTKILNIKAVNKNNSLQYTIKVKSITLRNTAK